MVKWLDDEHPEGEWSDKKFAAQVGLIAAKRDAWYGNDGHLRVFVRWYRYQGIPYCLAIQRYFYYERRPNGTIQLKDAPIRIFAPRWVVLDHLPLMPGPSEFLYSDSTSLMKYSGSTPLMKPPPTIRVQWTRLRDLAHYDIARLSSSDWLKIQAWLHLHKEEVDALFRQPRPVRPARKRAYVPDVL